METLHIQLLCNMHITYGNTPVMITSARLQSLLAFLLIYRATPQSRQHIAFAFWPNLSEIKARNNLRQVVFDLRRVLPDAECFVEIKDTTLQWRAHASFTLDVLDFERELANAEQSPCARRAALERAVGIYQGDLLTTCYDDWILPERERLRQCFVRATEELVELLEAQREYHRALAQAQRLLRYDPLREETYRDLMRLASRCGDRTGVIRYHRACVNTLRRELEVEPSAETQRTFEQSLSVLAARPPVEPTRESLAPAKTNLPLQPNRFVGRRREVEQVKQLLAQHRLVTLTGPCGVGKTRLALAIATESNLPNGVWFVGLGAVTDLPGVAQSVAATLGIREAGRRRVQDALPEYLRDKQLLLVLDNCEHLVAPLRVLMDEWLRVAPGLRILATSREMFDIPIEIVYRVPPLDVPETKLGADEQRVLAQDQLSAIAQSDSVQLFCDRVSAILPTFELSAENARFVASICRQLDGLPLAIELAAARMNVLSAAQIYRRLDAALGLLTRRHSGALHQQTLQATLDWGYDLLTAPERALLRRLAVFAGSFSLEAVEHICDVTVQPDLSLRAVSAKQSPALPTEDRSAEIASSQRSLLSMTPEQLLCDIPPAAMLDVLSNLVDKSLVEPLPVANTMRYRLLEVVRQFACAKLRDAGEESLVRQRHRDYFLQWAECSEPELRGAQQLDWFTQFEREHDNLRAALEWCRQDTDAEKGLRLASALWWFWRTRGYLSEGRARVAQMLALPDASVHATIRARALNVAGFLALFQGDFAAARQHAQDALAIAQPADDKSAMAMALFVLGDDVVAESVERGIAMRQQSLALSEAIGDKWMMAFTLNALGELARLQDDYAAARAYYEAALQIRREIQDQRGIAVCLNNLGFVACHQGQFEQACGLMRQALASFWELQSVVGVAEALIGMIGTIVENGNRDAIQRAAQWLGSLSAQLDDIWTPLTGADRREFETVTARVRACLGEDDLQRALAAGRQMSLARAVADALEHQPLKPT
jgi:predicted ATPase/DNA-binding SARP family transcriptional activator